MIAKLSRFFHSVKYLKLCQIYYRFYYKARPLRIKLSIKNLKVRNYGQWHYPILKQQSYDVATSSFSFLNVTGKYTGKLWHDERFDKLWLYNLHYFDYLGSSASDDVEEYMGRWIDANPPLLGIGWEPYPLSLRIVNWIKHALSGRLLSNDVLESLYLQVRALDKQVEYHLLGNHIFENYKALCFAGLFFEGAEADKWLQKGISGLEHEVPEQILNDGGHFELSPMYHSIVLEGMLDLYNLLSCYNRKVNEQWVVSIQKMRRWLKVMTHPDGKLSFFNDAALNVAPRLSELEDYAARLDLGAVDGPTNGITYLQDSGYVRLQNESVVAILDCAKVGPAYIPGHAHADILSFELSLNQQRVIVNSGTGTYSDLHQRAWQRSTAAHSTLEINDQDSSEVWGAFRVARRVVPSSLVFSKDSDELMVTCRYKGFNKSGEVSRTWRLDKGKFLVEDYCTKKAQVAVRYYISPDIEVIYDYKIEGYKLSSNGMQHAVVTDKANSFQLGESKYYPEFGRELDNQVLFQSGIFADARLELEWEGGQ